MPKTNAVINPSLGLFFDRAPIAYTESMLIDGLNFRVKNGTYQNLNLGWEPFDDLQLNGPVTLIQSFFLPDGTETLLMATITDIYEYHPNTNSVTFLTTRYETGTVAASGTAVTGSGTTWSTNASPGDEISFSAAENDPAATWYTIDTVDSNTEITLTASAGTIGAGSAYTIRQKLNGTLENRWSHSVFVKAPSTNDNQLWITNGLDPVFYWNGTDDQVTVPVLGFTAKMVTSFSNMMIFSNINQGGTQLGTDMINSDVGDATDVSSGLSEQFKVGIGSEEIIMTRVLGDYIVFYTRSTITIAQFVGGDLVFVFRTVSNRVGSTSRAVADFGDYHEFIGKDALYRFNGASVISINSHVWRSIISQRDPGRIEQAYTQFDDEQGELIWVVPRADDPLVQSLVDHAPPSKAVTEHYLEPPIRGVEPRYPHSLRDFPFTATGYYSRQAGLTWDQITSRWEEVNFRWNDQFFATASPLILAGDNDGYIYTLNTAQNADGAALNSYVRFGRRALIDGRKRGLLTRIYPFMQRFNNSVNITVHMYDHASATTTASTTTIAYDQNLNESDYFVTPYRRGRFLEIQFGTNDISKPYILEGFDLEIRSGGKR